MSVYYVTHPNLDLSAVVTAPTTEKARTTFLDYLERRGLLSRAHRGFLRENMVAERITNPESVTADIELSYGYEPMPEESFTLEPEHVQEQRAEVELGGEQQVPPPSPIEVAPPPPVVQAPLQPTKKRMPIAEVALRGFGK